jgi:hypothetical protein
MGTSRCVSSSHRWRIPDWQLGSGEPPFVNLYLERSIRPSPLEQTRSSPRAPVGRFHSDLPSKTREIVKHCPAEKLVELDKQPTPPLRGRVLCRGAREGCVCGSSVENGQSGKAGGWADISTTPSSCQAYSLVVAALERRVRPCQHATAGGSGTPPPGHSIRSGASMLPVWKI